MDAATDQESQWRAARARMERYLRALFWQDLAIGSPEQDTYVNWILDQIVRAEYQAAASGVFWCVYRLDDNGNQFLVGEYAEKRDADLVVAEYTAKGHKQSYWAERKTRGGVA